MARDITVFFDDGTSHVYRNAPDDVTPEQVTARAQSDFTGKTVRHLDGGRGETVDSGIPQRKKETTANPFMGMAARGAELGANLLEGAGRVAESVGDVIGEAAPALDRKLVIDKEGIRLTEPITQEEREKKRQLDSSDLLPVFKWADSLKNWGAEINYEPSTKLKDLSSNPLRAVPFIVERLISSSPDMVAAAAIPEAYLTSLTNETLNERLKNDGKSLEDATVGDVAAAFGGAAVQTFLEKFATGRLLKPGAVEGATTAIRVAKEAGVQAGTEAAEEVGGYAAETVGTKKGFDPEEAALIAAEAAIVGGGLGAGAKGLHEYAARRAERAQAETFRAATDRAQARLQEIEANPQATEADKAEAEFIKNNLGNPSELVTRYAPVTTTEEKPVTDVEQTVVTPPAEIKTAEDLINAPPKVSAEYASDELRNEASKMNDDAIYEEIDKIEQLRDQVANLLFDPAQLEAQASLEKVSVEDLTTRLTQQFDELATRLDVFHKDFMGRMEPTVQAPVQQRAYTPQELTAANISPELIKALNLRVEEAPPVQPNVPPTQATPEVPSGTEPLSPSAAESTQREPVGGGVAVPPQGQPPAGRVAPQVEGEGVEPAAGTVSDVNVGEAASEPALEGQEAPAAEEPAATSSQISDIAEQYARGEITLDELSERISQLSQTPQTQAGAAGAPPSTPPPPTPPGASGAAPLPPPIPGGPQPTTALGMRAQMLGTINNIGAAVNSLPKPTSRLYAAVRGFLGSTLPEKTRDAFYAFTSLPQQVETFARELPTLRNLLNVLNVRASELKARREVLDRNVRKWTAAINKYSQFKDEFYYVAHESTRLQVEFNKNPNHPLSRRFAALPPELQQVYWEMLSSYRDMSADYIRLLSKNLSPSQVKKLQRDMAKKRLRVYLPLYREGDYWMRYQDAQNETVVQSFKSSYERDMAWKEAAANGATGYQPFSRLEDFFKGQGPGTFFNRTLEELDSRGASMATKRALYELYLDQIPAASVRQLYRKRDGYAGYESDLMNVYATVASRMVNQLTNLEYIPEIDKVHDEIKQEANLYLKSGQAENLAVNSLMKNLDKQLDFLRDPSNGWITNKLSSFSYYWYIIGNASTALINTTQLPMVVLPMLSGKYDFDKTVAAMAEANKIYFNGGWDNDNIPGGVKRFPSDFSFGITQPPNSPLGRLYRAAVRQSALRRSTGYDLMEGRKKTFGMGDYVGMWAKTEQIAGWMFQNSERYNREITLIAAFNLELEKNGGNVDGAINTAIDLVTRAHGTTLAETSPRIFQTGFGKIAFTFKNFAQTQIYLQAKLLRDAVKGETPEMRKIAAKQMFGIMAMSWAFAGLHGMPFYSAITLLADITKDLWGDEDDPTKADEIVRQSTNELAWKGLVNQLFMADVASRTGFNGLLWRDDDKRLEEVGPILFAMEQVFGPSYAAFMNIGRGFNDYKEGHYDRAMEAIVPSFLRNGLKSWRYYTEGAKTRDGAKIYDDFDAYQLFLQTIGFTPTDISERSELAGAAASKKADIAERKTALLNRLYLARVSKDREGIRQAREAIKKFNQNPFVKKSRSTIGYDDMEKSYKMHRQNARNSVYGVNVPKSAASAFKKEYKKEEDR